MPWELTIRATNETSLGDRETVVKRISAAVPGIEWIEEPPLLEQIKDMPDHPFHALIPTWPESTRASFSRSKLLGIFDAAELSMRLYGFEAQPIRSVCAEVRGNGDPLPLLAAICNPNGWCATDDRDGQQIDLTAESAKGWEWFRDYRNRAIHSIEAPKDK
jgi:hypothetical protein